MERDHGHALWTCATDLGGPGAGSLLHSNIANQYTTAPCYKGALPTGSPSWLPCGSPYVVWRGFRHSQLDRACVARYPYDGCVLVSYASRRGHARRRLPPRVSRLCRPYLAVCPSSLLKWPVPENVLLSSARFSVRWIADFLGALL